MDKMTAKQVRTHIIDLVTHTRDRSSIGDFTLKTFVNDGHIEGLDYTANAGEVIRMAESIEASGVPVTFVLDYSN